MDERVIERNGHQQGDRRIVPQRPLPLQSLVRVAANSVGSGVTEFGVAHEQPSAETDAGGKATESAPSVAEERRNARAGAARG